MEDIKLLQHTVIAVCLFHLIKMAYSNFYKRKIDNTCFKPKLILILHSREKSHYPASMWSGVSHKTMQYEICNVICDVFIK